jgi:UPF0716 protein FxsA
MPFLLLIGLVGLETWGILQAVHRVGGGPVLAWMIGAAIIGIWLIRRSGMNAIRLMQLSIARGELPAVEIFQALITAFAGLLLILPGFITDVIAVSLLIGGGGLKRGIAQKLSAQMAQARPDLKKPVTLDGEFRRR